MSKVISRGILEEIFKILWIKSWKNRIRNFCRNSASYFWKKKNSREVLQQNPEKISRGHPWGNSGGNQRGIFEGFPNDIRQEFQKL